MKKYKKALTMMDIVVSFAILSCFILFLFIFLKNFMSLEADTKKLRKADAFASNAMEILRSYIIDEEGNTYEEYQIIK